MTSQDMKKQVRNRIIYITIIIVIFICILIGFVLYSKYIHNKYIQNRTESQKNELIKDDFYPVKDVMLSDGYKEEEPYVFEKNVSGKDISVSFDFKEKLCSKNQYEFPLDDVVRENDSVFYVKRDKLESILNCKLEYRKGTVAVDSVNYEAHEWTEFPALIAHAGGTIREKEYNSYYTNSLEALVTNYNLGHRVFEFDFYLTSDQKLAAVHDWVQFGYQDGTALSSEEWKNFKTYGSPVTEGRYTTMLVEDILDEMMVNKDIFIVTDTKAFEITDEETRLQFQLIYDEAMKRDPELLNRFIPQIYNEEMYEMLASIYHFPSIIYTIYATTASAEQIMNFSVQHDNIKVITAPVSDLRFGEEEIDTLHSSGLLLYNHTIHTYAELSAGRAKGVDGFYTGLLLPRDINLYEQLEGE
ncbi:glycerophosphodiester phosphodiesterase family protein [Lachnospiraceae bacterium 48-21]